MRSVGTGPSIRTSSPRATRKVFEKRNPGGTLEHLGHPSADATVDLNETGTAGCEFDLRVQATDPDVESLDGGGGQGQHRRLLALLERGRNEEPGLAKVLSQGKPAGEGQMTDDTRRGHALDRDVRGVGPFSARRDVGQVPLQHHVGAAGTQGGEQPIQLGPVAGQEGVAAALGGPGLEDRRPSHLGLGVGQITLSLVGPDDVAGRHVQTGRAQDLALSGLVGQGRGRGG